MADDDDVGSGEGSKIPSSSSSSAVARIRRKKSSKRSRLQSFFPLDSLHDTTLLEILIRLPCKSCFKFKAVSKRWLSLISESYYIRRLIYYNSRVNPNPCFHDEYDDPIVEKNLIGALNFLPFTVVSRSCELLLTDTVFNSSGFSLSFLPGFKDRKPIVVASWKDLLLCSSYNNLQSYYICNPLTRQVVQLPNASGRVRYTSVGFIVEPLYHFNDDRETIDLNYGFRYRVVRFVFPLGFIRGKEVEIFDSELGKWQSFAVVGPDPRSSLSRHDSPSDAPILAHCGMLHWWKEPLFPSKLGLVSFDPSKKRVVHIAKPEDMETLIAREHDNMVCLGSCRSKIRVYQLFRRYVDVATFSIWELRDSESGIWQLLHKVSIGHLNLRYRLLAQQTLYVHSSQDGMESSLRRVFCHPDDEDLVYLVFDTGFALYNIRIRALTHVAPLHLQQYDLRQPGLFPLQLQCWPTPVDNSPPKETPP